MNISNLKEKITGAIVGYAIGDALGLSTELMTREEVNESYPNGVNDYSDIISDAHRSQWGAGHHTHDTVFVSILAENFIRDGKIDPSAFAHSMWQWFGKGHYDIPTILRAVLSNPDYKEHPIEASKATTLKLGHQAETGAVLGLAMVAGMVTARPEEKAQKICSTLENGPLALATSAAIAHTSHVLLWKNYVPDADELIAATQTCSGDIESAIQAAASLKGIDRLEIDDEDEMWLASKCLGAALWTLWNFNTFEEGIKHVVMLGGEADANTALAGGLLGLRFGLSAIPARWKDGFAEYDKILDLANRFADKVIDSVSINK